MGLLLCSKSCDDYRTVAKLCDDFAEPYPVLPTVQHLTLKGMIALIGYTITLTTPIVSFLNRAAHNGAHCAQNAQVS